MFGSRNALCGLARHRPKTALRELLLASTVYVPFLCKPFGTFSVRSVDWAIALVAAFTISPRLETTKTLECRSWIGRLS